MSEGSLTAADAASNQLQPGACSVDILIARRVPGRGALERLA